MSWADGLRHPQAHGIDTERNVVESRGARCRGHSSKMKIQRTAKRHQSAGQYATGHRGCYLSAFETPAYALCNQKSRVRHRPAPFVQNHGVEIHDELRVSCRKVSHSNHQLSE